MTSAPEPARPRVADKDPLGSFGKIVGALAGAGVFLYLIGVVVFWEALTSVHLNPRDVVPAIPREQVAVLGARETLLSAIAGVIFALFLYGFYRLFRFSERAVVQHGFRGRLVRWMRNDPPAFVTATVAPLAVFGPADARGVVLLVLFLINVYLGMRSAHRSLIGELPDFETSLRPWMRVAAGLAIAVLLASVARQSAFPDEFSRASIRLKDGRFVTPPGLYLGSSADTIVIGIPPDLVGARCSIPDHPASRIMLVERSTVARIELTDGPEACRPPGSLLRHLTGIPIDCIAPLCQIGDKPHRVSLLSPFAPG